VSHLQRIRDAFDRMAHVFDKRPSAALDSGVMSARIVEGLRCEAREGDWQFVVDMPRDAGGTGAGPSPGVHGRAALASCLAIGYGISLARAGIEPRSLEVIVQADFDNRGLLGMADVYPGYLAVRHTLYLDCDAPADKVLAAVEQAQRTSPYLHVFADAQPVSGQVVLGRRPQP
jgi:uncharacterized OsmC-like protein